MEQGKEQMTVVEALRITADILRKIELPVSLTEKAAVPIARSISNIELCIGALEEEARKADEIRNETEEHEIQLNTDAE